MEVDGSDVLPGRAGKLLMATYTSKVLGQLPTALLLMALRMTRAHVSRANKLIDEVHAMRGLPVIPSDKAEDDDSILVEAWLLGGSFHCDNSVVTVNQLKAELAKRPHVPNKQESKAIRKAKQENNRRKGRRDR